MTIRILAGPTVPAIIAIARTWNQAALSSLEIFHSWHISATYAWTDFKLSSEALVAWVTLAAAVFLAAVAVVGLWRQPRHAKLNDKTAQTQQS